MARMLFVEGKSIESKSVKEIMRRLWLTIGASEHALDPALLLQTYALHKKMDTVPKSYDTDCQSIGKTL